MANENAISAAELVVKFKKSLDEGWGYIWGKTHEMWSAEKQAAYEKAYAGDTDRAMSVKYGGKWAGHWVTDCSGLFAYWFSQMGGKMYHGSNTMYKAWCTSKGQLKAGKRTDGQSLKPGTAIFTGTEEKHGHVGLYVGDGLIIEAKGTTDGVVKSKITESRWTYWGELKGVDYGKTEPEKAGSADKQNDGKPTIRRGSKGEYVTLAQTMLMQRGYNLPKYGADGDFGSETETAVKQFQQDWGLAVDGVIGEKTWAMLEQSMARVPETQAEDAAYPNYSVVIKGLDYTQAVALQRNYPASEIRKE